jgi:hypothetical protein
MKTDLSRINRDLPDLNPQEVQFLLALIGAEPHNNGPRTITDAYWCLKPEVTKEAAYDGGRRILARIKAKGGIAFLLGAYGLDIPRIAAVLDECTRAEVVNRVSLGNGHWDYDVRPDYRTRLRAAQTLLILHGEQLTSAGRTASGNDMRETFAEAILRQKEERQRLLDNPNIQDAEEVDE